MQNWLFKLLAIWLVFGFLISFPIETSGSFTLVFSLAVLTWLVYQFVYPVFRFKRAAMLEKALDPNSFFQIFSDSLFVKISAFFSSISIAVIALFSVASFGKIANLSYLEWSLLFISAISFLFFYKLFLTKAKTHLKQGNEYLLLRPAVYLNLILLVVIYTFIYLIFADVVSKPVNWQLILQEQTELITAENYLLEMVLIYLNSVQVFLLQVIIAGSTLEMGFWPKLLAWLAFIVLNAIKMLVVWWVALGIISYLLKQTAEVSEKDKSNKVLNSFTISLVLFFATYLLGSNINLGGLWQKISNQSETQNYVYQFNPCNDQIKLKQQQEISFKLEQNLLKKQQDIYNQLDSFIEQAIENVFSSEEVDKGIESFLDWNFSIAGSYVQIFFKGKDLVDSDGLNKYLEQRFQQDVGNSLNLALQQEFISIDKQLATEMNKVAQLVTESIEDADFSCLAFDVGDLKTRIFTDNFVGAAGLAGVISARISAQLSAKITTRVAAKITAKISAKVAAKVSAQIAAKLTAIGSGAAAGVAACSPTGPFAVICGFGGAAALWLGADYLVVTIDELLNRDELKAEILQSFSELKDELKHDLTAAYRAQIDDVFIDTTKNVKEATRVIDLINN